MSLYIVTIFKLEIFNKTVLVVLYQRIFIVRFVVRREIMTILKVYDQNCFQSKKDYLLFVPPQTRVWDETLIVLDELLEEVKKKVGQVYGHLAEKPLEVYGPIKYSRYGDLEVVLLDFPFGQVPLVVYYVKD